MHTGMGWRSGSTHYIIYMTIQLSDVVLKNSLEFFIGNEKLMSDKEPLSQQATPLPHPFQPHPKVQGYNDVPRTQPQVGGDKPLVQGRHAFKTKSLCVERGGMNCAPHLAHCPTHLDDTVERGPVQVWVVSPLVHHACFDDVHWVGGHCCTEAGHRAGPAVGASCPTAPGHTPTAAPLT